MGGGQTLSLALEHPQDFAYVGVFSSGLFQRNLADWESKHQADLDNAEAKAGLKLLWFRTGKEDFLLQSTHNTVDLLKKHEFKPVFEESGGGHTWLNWRQYLIDFAPQLFSAGGEKAKDTAALNECADVEGLRAKLKAAGVTTEDGRPVPWRRFLVRDPFGNRIDMHRTPFSVRHCP